MTGPNAFLPPQGPPSGELFAPPIEVGKAAVHAAEVEVVNTADTFDSVGDLFASYEASGFAPSLVTEGTLDSGDFTLAYLRSPSESPERLYKGALTTQKDGKPVTRELPRIWQFDARSGSYLSFYTGDNPQVLAAIAAAEGVYDPAEEDSFGYDLKGVLADLNLLQPGEIIKVDTGFDPNTHQRNTTFEQVVTVD